MASRFRSIKDLEPYRGRTAADLSAGEALNLVDVFRGLEWWLAPEVLDRAWSSPLASGVLPSRREGSDLPELPQEPGCLVIVAGVSAATLEAFPILRSGVLVPLQWKTVADEGEGHDPRLPEELRRLAEEVRGKVRDREGRSWRLWLGPWVDSGVDLSEVPMGWESGWAALASALYLAIRGGEARRDVWVSSQWSGQGIDKVAHLEAKLRLAAAARVTEFFVAKEQVEEARRIVEELGDSGMEIVGLESGVMEPEKSLRPLLDRLQIAPGPEADRDRRVRWYLNLLGDDRDEYYHNNLFDDIVADCQQKMREGAGRTGTPWRPTLLVTILSKGTTWLVGAAALEPEHCLLLYTEDDAEMPALVEPASGRFRKRFGDRLSLELVGFSGKESNPEHLTRLLRDRVQGIPPERIAVDVTPGTSWMKLAMLSVAPSSSRLVCIVHEFDAYSRGPEPFTERIQLSIVKQALELEGD